MASRAGNLPSPNRLVRAGKRHYPRIRGESRSMGLIQPENTSNRVQVGPRGPQSVRKNVKTGSTESSSRSSSSGIPINYRFHGPVQSQLISCSAQIAATIPAREEAHSIYRKPIARSRWPRPSYLSFSKETDLRSPDDSVMLTFLSVPLYKEKEAPMARCLERPIS